MADDADRAEEIMALHLRLALQAAWRRSADLPSHGMGHCLWCAAPLAAPRRWCDAGCRDDFEADRRPPGP